MFIYVISRAFISLLFMSTSSERVELESRKFVISKCTHEGGWHRTIITANMPEGLNNFSAYT